MVFNSSKIYDKLDNFDIVKSLFSDEDIPHSNILHLSLVTRKPVFGVCDQLRLKPACLADEIS